MGIESTVINYRCPDCDHSFPVTLRMLFQGLINCPSCRPEKTDINLNELVGELNALSVKLARLRQNLKKR